MTAKEAIAAALGGIGAAFVAGKVVFGNKKTDTTTPAAGETTSATTAETTPTTVTVETPTEENKPE